VGKKGTSSQSFTVDAGLQPFADFVFSPVSTDVNKEVFFDASLSTPPPGRAIVSYAWNFGDGSTGTGRTTRHGFRRAGEFVVVLTVRDSEGSIATTSQSVIVGRPPGLAADFSISPDPATTGEVVQFDASLSTPSTGATITSYSWNFGDPMSGSNTASARTATHTYGTAGTYTVTLRVRDSTGQTAVASKTVSVEDP
jgi:PKD repeat protein